MDQEKKQFIAENVFVMVLASSACLSVYTQYMGFAFILLALLVMQVIGLGFLKKTGIWFKAEGDHFKGLAAVLNVAFLVSLSVTREHKILQGIAIAGLLSNFFCQILKNYNNNFASPGNK